MNYNEVLKKAKENLNGSCRVCPVCDGKACRGEVPGMGGKGTGSSFMENVTALSSYKLNMRVVSDVKDPDTSITMFGKEMDIPVFAAPVSGTTLNMAVKGSSLKDAEDLSSEFKNNIMAIVNNACK